MRKRFIIAALAACFTVGACDVPSSGSAECIRYAANDDGSTTIFIPKEATRIPVRYFQGLEGVSEIRFEPDSCLNEIGDFAFSKISVQSVQIPASVETLGVGCFYECPLLEIVEFEDGSRLEKIGSGCFSFCKKLKFAFVPEKVKCLEGDCFCNCETLEEATFSEHSLLRQIEKGVFSFCPQLRGIYVPNSVEHIGDLCFEGCLNLDVVTFESGSKLESVGNDIFKNCPRLRTIYVFSSDSHLPDLLSRPKIKPDDCRVEIREAPWWQTDSEDEECGADAPRLPKFPHPPGVRLRLSCISRMSTPSVACPVSDGIPASATPSELFPKQFIRAIPNPLNNDSLPVLNVKQSVNPKREIRLFSPHPPSGDGERGRRISCQDPITPVVDPTPPNRGNFVARSLQNPRPGIAIRGVFPVLVKPEPKPKK
ncbi:MAG: leucine-rich repeat domain-containing protein [Holosporaceae bacterium]|jgi:hypothetical protein|nr:leucine-rich repeat domain-containing protein [Holosporaceae bacterium]